MFSSALFLKYCILPRLDKEIQNRKTIVWKAHAFKNGVNSAVWKCVSVYHASSFCISILLWLYIITRVYIYIYIYIYVCVCVYIIYIYIYIYIYLENYPSEVNR